MFLKEVLSIFSLSSLIFTSSGFAIKVKKFEHNQLFINPKDNSLQLLLTEKSFHKIGPKTDTNFSYLKRGNIEASKNILKIEKKDNLYELTLDPDKFTKERKIELIKYPIESKSFWSNLFT